MKLGHSLPIPDPTFSTRKNFSTLFTSQRRTNCSDSKLHNRASQPAYSMPIACGRRWRTSPRRLKPGRSNDQKDSISLVSTFFSFAPSFFCGSREHPMLLYTQGKNRCSAPGKHNDDESAVHIPSLSMRHMSCCPQFRHVRASIQYHQRKGLASVFHVWFKSLLPS